ncbi:uncharacterized protein SPPG_08728 [Spizellomyces punctatus DAOM BR117]|uniref:Metallo-beta-lactamase domain-containing protein n=1 Tax=Spizellomyces punctatus (strain DAOM BR117) TaxID=645134 RepID=A0A0L0H4F3_SPIPD|nr:uncharacterized protein SPPG_08728 [Spizellomyces punctatus DAOM BR117]KNC95864.1 hypothetical protein SPPG_08728 [Spizellomyces punctatus DAOM BR117]|eukprot:XP_016603904.1 hypothetical protein SPPG_08728 [Spizellomyces punctatus DAOM BR117]
MGHQSIVALGVRPYVFAAVPVALLGSILLFEQSRWLWHRRHRRRAIERHWEYIDGQMKEVEEVENANEAEEEEGLEPANPDETRKAVALSRAQMGFWRQKVYTSLKFAGRFVNPFLEWRDKNATNIWEYVRWQLTRHNRNGIPKDNKVLAESLPTVQPNWELLQNFHNRSSVDDLEASWITLPSHGSRPSMTVTWFGQSTCLVQMDGYNILTDPIFSSRTVGNWLGPRRLRPVPCNLSDLPKIDIVLVSHDHYDHLDRAVVKELGNSVTWYVPLGLRDWFGSHGVTNVVELDWWEERLHENTLRIIGTPIQHWSGRHFFDVNRTLWCSFVVKGPTSSFFHCGDTGYCTAFKEIGKKYGPITLAALPIGAYEPRWFLRHQHVDPDEACQIHTDLNASYSIGVHWGTFMMSDEHYLDPPKYLEESRIRRNLAEGTVFTSRLGETVCIPK